MTQAWIPAPAPHFSGNCWKISQELSGDLHGESPAPHQDRQPCSSQCKQCKGSTHNPTVSLSNGRGLKHPPAGREGGAGGSAVQSHSAQPWCPPASFFISPKVLQSARLLRVKASLSGSKCPFKERLENHNWTKPHWTNN